MTELPPSDCGPPPSCYPATRVLQSITTCHAKTHSVILRDVLRSIMDDITLDKETTDRWLGARE